MKSRQVEYRERKYDGENHETFEKKMENEHFFSFLKRVFIPKLTDSNTKVDPSPVRMTRVHAANVVKLYRAALETNKE